jgi:hypothetical protein
MILLLLWLVWSFEQDAVGAEPKGFEFASAKGTQAGRWAVEKDGENHVLAQRDADESDDRFAMALVIDSKFKDLTLSVRGKPLDGRVDRAVGVVWRYKDENNYYVARSNILEKNVRLYRVVDGRRIRFAGKEKLEFKAGEWQTLKIEHKGYTIAVFLNGEKLFEAEDKTFPDAGKIGVWIKSDSITLFDDLNAEELK